MEHLKRLIVTEAKSVPSLLPLHVFLTQLAISSARGNNNNSKNIIDDDGLLDFLIFRGSDGKSEMKSSNGISAYSSNHCTAKLPQLTLEGLKNVKCVIPSSSSTEIDNNNINYVRKNRIVFCDNSILQNRSLSMLESIAASPSSPVLSFVFPFSTVVLARFQMAQPEGAVSSAFKVNSYSQLRQLAAMANRKQQNNDKSGIISKVCVLSPSAELELLFPSRNPKSSSIFATKTPQSLLAMNCLTGEGSFYAHMLPLLLLAAQRDHFGSAAGRSCVAVCGSAHRQVQSQCLKLGMPCDSLLVNSAVNNNNNSEATDGSSMANSSSSIGNGINFHHRKASDLCRKYVQKLKNIEEVSSKR